jgi:hypothetical protein
MTPKRIVLLVVLVLVVGLGWLFWVQNSATAVNLILKLPFGLAWDLGPEGISLPLLLLIAAGVGAVVAAVVLGAMAMGARGRASARGRMKGSRSDDAGTLRQDPARTARPFPGSPRDDDDLA